MAAICVILLLLSWQIPLINGQDTWEQVLEKIQLSMTELRDIEPYVANCIRNVSSYYNCNCSRIETVIGSITDRLSSSQISCADCSDFMERYPTAGSGVYTVYHGGIKRDIYCDMETRGGGWTVLLNRFDGRLDFSLKWDEMKNFVGDLGGEYFIGLELMHQIAGKGGYELLVELSNGEDSRIVKYDSFRVSSEEDDFRLFVSRMNSDLSNVTQDDLYRANGTAFSTLDRDNDPVPQISCSRDLKKAPGWHGKQCTFPNLFGRYCYGVDPKPKDEASQMSWSHYNREVLSCLKSLSLKTRPNRK